MPEATVDEDGDVAAAGLGHVRTLSQGDAGVQRQHLITVARATSWWPLPRLGAQLQRVAVTAYAANDRAVRFYRRCGFEPKSPAP